MKNIETKKRDVVTIILFAVGAILILMALSIEIPSNEFSFVDIKEYVGGDAYNAMIEASIRSGEIAGARISKAVYMCSGIIVMAISSLRSKNK